MGGSHSAELLLPTTGIVWHLTESLLTLVLELQSSESPQPGDMIQISCHPHQHWVVYVGDGFGVMDICYKYSSIRE